MMRQYGTFVLVVAVVALLVVVFLLPPGRMALAAGLARIAQRPPAAVDEVRAVLGIRDRRPARA